MHIFHLDDDDDDDTLFWPARACFGVVRFVFVMSSDKMCNDVVLKKIYKYKKSRRKREGSNVLLGTQERQMSRACLLQKLVGGTGHA